MRKALFFFLTLVLSLLLHASFARAISLDFVPSSQKVLVGNPLDVSIVISGLVDNAAPSLGTFDLDVLFNPLLLAFNSVVFGNQLDLFGLGSNTSVTPGAGNMNLFELSLDLPGDLENQQAGSFTLASLTFNTLAVGVSPLSLSVNALGDATGNSLVADVSGGSITTTAIPEPSTLLLLGSGLIGLVVFKRKLLWLRRDLSK